MAKKKTLEELLKEVSEDIKEEEEKELIEPVPQKQRVNCPFYSRCLEKNCEECDA